MGAIRNDDLIGSVILRCEAWDAARPMRSLEGCTAELVEPGRRPSRLALRRVAPQGAHLRVTVIDWSSGHRLLQFKYQTHLRRLAAHSARVLLCSSRPLGKEGAGKAGCRLAPARLPCENVAHARHRRDTGQPKHPAFPARWFDGLCALSPETNSVLSPSLLRNSRTPPRLKRRRLRKGLTVATTARTTRFAVRFERRSSARRRDLTGFIPPCSRVSCPALPASTAARSAARDDVRPPLFPDQDGGRMR
ncbi:hypothetical protein ABIB73_002400 [Bradyrhizobium sp. F1.4.3]